MAGRGKKKRRNRRRHRGAAADRAGQTSSVGGLPLWLVADQGLLQPNTGREAGPRVRASVAERAHVERLQSDPEEWEPRGRVRGTSHGSRG